MEQKNFRKFGIRDQVGYKAFITESFVRELIFLTVRTASI